MKELFLQDGHLTDEALNALIEGSLDEEQRMEVGEHLSFCDRCLDRYTALLTGELLEEPPKDQTLPTMRKVQKKKMRSTLRRYASAAAAVAIGSVFWYSGVFQAVGETLTQQPESFARPPISQQQEQRPSRLGDDILEAVNEWSIWIKESSASAFRPVRHQPHSDVNSSNQMEAK